MDYSHVKSNRKLGKYGELGSGRSCEWKDGVVGVVGNSKGQWWGGGAGSVISFGQILLDRECNPNLRKTSFTSLRNHISKF